MDEDEDGNLSLPPYGLARVTNLRVRRPPWVLSVPLNRVLGANEATPVSRTGT
eukprot:COSAG06_NODE_53518_length_299_cov_1.475000_1_plen_52_part_01